MFSERLQSIPEDANKCIDSAWAEGPSRACACNHNPRNSAIPSHPYILQLSSLPSRLKSHWCMLLAQ